MKKIYLTPQAVMIAVEQHLLDTGSVEGITTSSAVGVSIGEQDNSDDDNRGKSGGFWGSDDSLW